MIVTIRSRKKKRRNGAQRSRKKRIPGITVKTQIKRNRIKAIRKRKENILSEVERRRDSSKAEITILGERKIGRGIKNAI